MCLGTAILLCCISQMLHLRQPPRQHLLGGGERCLRREVRGLPGQPQHALGVGRCHQGLWLQAVSRHVLPRSERNRFGKAPYVSKLLPARLDRHLAVLTLCRRTPPRWGLCTLRTELHHRQTWRCWYSSIVTRPYKRVTKSLGRSGDNCRIIGVIVSAY